MGRVSLRMRVEVVACGAAHHEGAKSLLLLLLEDEVK